MACTNSGTDHLSRPKGALVRLWKGAKTGPRKHFSLIRYAEPDVDPHEPNGTWNTLYWRDVLMKNGNERTLIVSWLIIQGRWASRMFNVLRFFIRWDANLSPLSHGRHSSELSRMHWVWNSSWWNVTNSEQNCRLDAYRKDPGKRP